MPSLLHPQWQPQFPLPPQVHHPGGAGEVVEGVRGIEAAVQLLLLLQEVVTNLGLIALRNARRQ